MEFTSENLIPIDAPSPAQALAQHKHPRCIVKLGGAAITCKNELEKINEESLRIVCSQLREAMKPETADLPAKVLGMDWSRRSGDSIESIVDEFDDDSALVSDGRFIIVHGAGSFGHFQASRSGVNKGGLNLPLVKAGFVATRISVTSLNLEIVRALAREGITAVGISPFACGWSTQGRNIACADVSHIDRVLCAGFVPVLHGDAVFDHSQATEVKKKKQKTEEEKEEEEETILNPFDRSKERKNLHIRDIYFTSLITNLQDLPHSKTPKRSQLVRFCPSRALQKTLFLILSVDPIVQLLYCKEL